MIHNHTLKEVRRYDIFKLIVAIILLLLLLFLSLSGFGNKTATVSAPTVTAPKVAWAAPVINAPAGDLKPGKLTLTGTGQPGEMLEVLVNGVSAGKVKVGADGKWSLDVDLPKAGDYKLESRLLNADGSVAVASAPLSLKVAEPKVAWAAPVINAPAGDLKPGKLTLTGTGQPGEMLEVLVNGVSAGKVKVGADGKWSLDVDLPKAGDYKLESRLLNADGSVAVASAPISVKIPEPKVAWAMPEINLPKIDLKPGKFTLDGIGQPGEMIEVLVNGISAGMAKVGADGKWSLDVDLPEAGDYKLESRLLNADGSVAVEGKPASITIPELKVDWALPEINLPKIDLKPGKFTLDGIGQPGEMIEVLVNGISAGMAKVGADGKWSLDVDLPEASDYRLESRLLNADGSVAVEGKPVYFTIPELNAGWAAPVINAPAGELKPGKLTLTGTGQPGEMLEVLVNGISAGKVKVGADGKWSLDVDLPKAGDYKLESRLLNADGSVAVEGKPMNVTVGGATAEAPAPATGTITIIFPADKADLLVGKLTVIGTSAPGATVKVLDGAAVLGEATAADNGEWQYTLTPAAGVHQYGAKPAADDAATPVAVTATVIEVGNPYNCASNPGINRGDNYIVGTCDTFGTISRLTGVDAQTLIAANPQIENPDLIYPGDTIIIPAR